MIYIDTLHDLPDGATFPGKQSCHLFANDLGELLKFAGRLGLQPGWLHTVRGFPHFDLTKMKRRRAIELGARSVSQRWAVEWRQRRALIYLAQHPEILK